MKNKSSFNHYDLKLVVPDFTSPLTDLIIELDSLRRKHLGGSTFPVIFFQLKHIFHTLESIGSARIEGNNTTILEYVESKITDAPTSNQGIREIENMERAMSFIDENVKDVKFDRSFVSELHKKVVDGLLLLPKGEGDATPGLYRTVSVSINRANHQPPEPLLVDGYMNELFDFINHNDPHKYDLLKIAIVHHRFLWIHPFRNGNGRTIRLFTYAMLVKDGFNVDVGRILNPTAVFCSSRKNYCRYLSLADTGQDKGILSWCEYVLKGLKDEIEKIDHLLDYKFLKDEILFPAIRYSHERKFITDMEAKILKVAVEQQVMRAAHLKTIFEGKKASEISRNIGRLKEKNMLMPIKKDERKYVIRFDNNFLLRGIIKQLGDKGFLPIKDEV
ncbi:MAG: Fic family protein [Nitrospiraceae bacterium]|nr:Fic family protein [Nitrospiraceae bacterium]